MSQPSTSHINHAMPLMKFSSLSFHFAFVFHFIHFHSILVYIFGVCRNRLNCSTPRSHQHTQFPLFHLSLGYDRKCSKLIKCSNTNIADIRLRPSHRHVPSRTIIRLVIASKVPLHRWPRRATECL